MKKIKLEKVLTRRKDEIEVQELETYKRLTIRMNGQGIEVRDCVLGSQIGTKKQFVVESGQLVLSKIDARNGAFGILPEACNNAIITGNFWAFDINRELLESRYFDYLTKTPLFVDFCIRASDGTTNRLYLQEPKFLNMEINLPSIAEQKRIVARIEELAAKIEEARGLRASATEETDALVFSETNRVFEDLKKHEWIPIGKLGINSANPIQTGPFGSQLLRSEFTQEGIPVINVGNIQPAGMKFEQLDYVTPEKAQKLSRYSLKTNDLLFARTGATLGKVCILPEECNNWLMTGHVLRVRFDQSKCNPKFAFLALRGSRIIRDQIFVQVRGATRPGFNTTLLSQVSIPLPSLREQQEIINHLDKFEKVINQLKQLREDALKEFEALLPAILDKALKGEL